MKNRFLHIFFLIATSPFLASEPEAEKPGYVRRGDEAVTTAAGAATGYWVTTRAAATIHEGAHAITGTATGYKPTGFYVRILPRIPGTGPMGNVKFDTPYIGENALHVPTRHLWGHRVPTLAAGPAAGIYFNYLMLNYLANKAENENKSFQEQLKTHPIKTGAQVGAAFGAIYHTINFIPFIASDGKQLLSSLVSPLARNQAIISAALVGSTYITTSLLGSIGTAWWLKNHLYKQWGFEKHPTAQQHLEIKPIERIDSE